MSTQIPINAEVIEKQRTDYNDATLNMTLLELSAIGDFGKVYAILTSDQCIDVNYQHPINKWTPLHWASKRGHERIVDLLLEYGADPTVKNMENKTPLDIAQSTLVKSALCGYNELHDKGLKCIKTTDQLSASNISQVSANTRAQSADSQSAPTVAQAASGGSSSSSFVPNYLKNPNTVPFTQTSCSDPIGAASMETTNEQNTIDDSQSRQSSYLSSPHNLIQQQRQSCPNCATNMTTQPTRPTSLANHIDMTVSSTASSRQSGREPLRLCVALPIIYKSAHEPEKKLYRNIYFPSKEKINLATFHKNISTAIQLSIDQLTSSRYVIVNEYDSTIIENQNDLLRLSDGTRIGVFERR